MEYLVYVNVIILNAKHPIILCLHASILEEDAISEIGFVACVKYLLQNINVL